MEIETLLMPNWIDDFDDYRQMYDLTTVELSKKILDFSAGTSSFNCEAHRQGMSVVSVDASYQLGLDEMRLQADHCFFHAVEQLRTNSKRLKASSEQAVLKVIAQWQKNLALFLADYATGKQEGRYQPCVLPTLPYEANQFQLALCTNYFFNQSMPRETILLTLKELARVAEEVRIFPLLDSEGNMPAELGPLMLYFQQNHFGVEVRAVSHRALKNGNAMLRVWEQECCLKSA
jgi:hypothetical protein